MDRFQGRIVHPQTGPEDLEYAGKRSIVIGSGATTATLVPAVAEACEHVTVLQRSPTYFFPGKNVNELADTLRELDIPEEWTHEIVRRKILQDKEALTRLSVEAHELLREERQKGVRELLPEGYEPATHFSTQHRPWHPRLASCPPSDP